MNPSKGLPKVQLRQTLFASSSDGKVLSFRVEGLGFRIWGLGFRVQGSFGAQGFDLLRVPIRALGVTL